MPHATPHSATTSSTKPTTSQQLLTSTLTVISCYIHIHIHSHTDSHVLQILSQHGEYFFLCVKVCGRLDLVYSFTHKMWFFFCLWLFFYVYRTSHSFSLYIIKKVMEGISSKQHEQEKKNLEKHNFIFVLRNSKRSEYVRISFFILIFIQEKNTHCPYVCIAIVIYDVHCVLNILRYMNNISYIECYFIAILDGVEWCKYQMGCGSKQT